MLKLSIFWDLIQLLLFLPNREPKKESVDVVLFRTHVIDLELTGSVEEIEF